MPHSNSLDSIGKKRFILIPDEEYDELKRRINSANHTLHQLEETKKQNQIEVENHKLLSKDSSTLHHQLSDLDCRLDHVMGRVDGGAGLLEPVKTAAFENITLLHKISSRRCQDEIRGVSIILDAISSKAQDEMSMLRRDKEKLQMNQIQFPSSFNENQKAPNNYNEYIETISRMRTKAQYKYHQLMVDTEKMNDKYNTLVKDVSARTRANAKELLLLQESLNMTEESRQMNSDEYRSLQLKFDALEKKKRSEQDFNEKKIDQLHHQLDALIFKDSDES